MRMNIPTHFRTFLRNSFAMCSSLLYHSQGGVTHRNLAYKIMGYLRQERNHKSSACEPKSVGESRKDVVKKAIDKDLNGWDLVPTLSPLHYKPWDEDMTSQTTPVPPVHWLGRGKMEPWLPCFPSPGVSLFTAPRRGRSTVKSKRHTPVTSAVIFSGPFLELAGTVLPLKEMGVLCAYISANNRLSINSSETVCSPTTTERHGASPEPGENELILK